MRERYEERTNTAIKIVKNAMQNSSRELWNCDPKRHIKGKPNNTLQQTYFIAIKFQMIRTSK